jgi:formate/nitrite transporter FocA (FNT family)
MSDTRADLGEHDEPAEDQVVDAFDAIVAEGSQRLHRSWREVLTTGLAGGLEVGTGVLALLAVYAETGSHLLAGIAFSIGLIALLLARSELFTEGFLVPVTAVAAKRASVAQLASCGAAPWWRTWPAAGW